MLQLSLIEENEHPELADLIGRIKESRRGLYCYPYKLLLHNPAIAEAWLEQVTASRWGTQIDGAIREIVIIRIAILTRVDFVRTVHETVHALNDGLSPEQVRAIADWRAARVFDAAQRAALTYTDAMTQSVQVPETVQQELQAHFNERQVIELTVLIGTYNMHVRVCQALDVGIREAAEQAQTG